MTSTQVSTKVRLVRCPKCRQVLAELPDVTLYKCGGCGIILQAKNRRMKTNNNERALQMKDAVANTQRDDALGEKGTRSSNGDSINPDAESSPNKKHVIYEHGESSKVSCSESEGGSTAEVKITLENGENECRLGQNFLESTEGRDSFDDFPSSREEKKFTTEDTQKQDGDGDTNECMRRDQNEGEESQKVLQVGEKFLVEDQNSPEVKDKGNYSPQDETTQKNEDFYGEIRGDGVESSSVEIVSHENGDSSQTVELSIEVYDDTEDLSTVNNPSTEKGSAAQHLHTVNECMRRDQNEGEISQKVLQVGEKFLGEDQNLPEVKDKGNDSSQDETTQNNEDFYGEIRGDGVESSSVEIVSHEDGDSSQTVELSIEVYDDTEVFITVNSPSSEKESAAQHLHTVNSPSTEKESEACVDNSTPPPIALKSPSTEELKTGIDDSTPQIALKSPSTEELKTGIDDSTPQIALTSTSTEQLKRGTDNSTPHQIALKSPSTENESKSSIDTSTPHIASQRSSISDDPISPDNEHLVRHRVSLSSVDTTGNSTPAYHISELVIKNGDTANSPTTSKYYVYDGSDSSYDGTDDRIQEHTSHPIRRTIKDVDPIRTTEVPARNRFRVNNTVNSDHVMNYRRPISSSILQERQHHSMKSRPWNHNEFFETKRESGFTRLPFPSREFTSDHRIGNPSVYHYNPLPPHPVFHSRDERPYSVPDKMDLLRTVCELKDQLDRIKLSRFAPNMRYPAQVVDEEPSHYYDRLVQEREIYADSILNPGRAERLNYHRPAFSGEAAHYRHQFNCSCSHCYPQDRYHSAQLPSHLSSPQQYSSSEISLWGRETKLDEEQRHREDEIKRFYLKEKYHTAKTHLRPLAGAAPFLTCYHCLELLQLPEDFLLVEKRCHRLRCNACKKVLKLSLLKRTRLVPYVSEGPAPSPSEAEPVSFSDEYRRSFDRNCSTEEDAANVLRLRKMKFTLKESRSKNRNLMLNGKSVGPSSKGMKMRKPSSEIEEERASTLHRLMGYASPSQVFEK